MTNKSTFHYNIHDDNYDLTQFVSLHPGGTDMFNNLKPNSNITSMIYSYHKDPIKLLDILPKYKIIEQEKQIQGYNQDNIVYTYDKYLELKKLVYYEMHEHKIPFFWSNQEIAHNTTMFAIYIAFYAYIFYNAATISIFSICCFIFINVGFGSLVFHETSHYTGYMPHYYFLLLYYSSDLLDHLNIKDLTFFGFSSFFII